MGVFHDLFCLLVGLFVHVEEVFGEVYQVGLFFCTSQGGV